VPAGAARARARRGDRQLSGPAPIEFQRASRWYGQVIALNDVSARIEPGVTGLLGPNGAGKSTFLKLAAGQLAPSQGDVRLLGRPAWGSPEVFHRVGLCPEADAFWDGLTGLQFLVALLGLTGFEQQEARQRAEHALEQVDLLAAKDRKIGAYSKGMRQRVKLAQALAHEPEVLLLDEPLTGMDPVNRRRVADLVKRLGREGRTVVVSSHILYEVEAMTRRVLLINNGRILAEGDVREIRDLMDEHPHTVSLRAKDPRAVARAVVGQPHVLSLAFGEEGEWLTVQTAKPDEFYGALLDVADAAGVQELYSPDEDLASVFKYLVPR
jgi:ABC-2 type transport system ATP-binding protein